MRRYKGMRMYGKQDNLSSDQAERWIVRLHADDCGPAERAAFERWRAASVAHAAAYDSVARLHRQAASLRGDPLLQAAARTARIHTARVRERRASWRRGVSLAVAALLLVAVGGASWYVWNPAQPEQRYVTGVGEKRNLRLDDGSMVLLDTASVVAVQYRRKQREVVLEQGQAQFIVASQPSRPFIVHARGGVVRAIGTRFQVRSDPDWVQVTLLEGKVEVNAPPPASGAAAAAVLVPGEQLRYGPGGRWERRAADLEVAQGWTQGELVFRNRPLGEIVTEMNRHTVVQLRLIDPSLRDLPISGVFYDNNQQSLVRALERGWSLHAEQASPDEIMLRRRE